MKKIRFFLSKLIFEMLLRRCSAEELGKEITHSVQDFNRRHRDQSCYSCGHKKLNGAISGSDGFFTSVNHFFRCPKCGNEQSSDGTHRQYEHRELIARKLVEDGTKYRYRILSDQQWFIVIVVSVILGVTCLVSGFFGLMFFY